MAKYSRRATFFLLICLLAFLGVGAQKPPAKAPQSPPPDLSKEPTLYVVGYAHLDTQWRWDFPTTINEYITKTMRLNFDLIEKYPHYVFNFSGANRYRMMKEYFPEDYEKVKKYVVAGRWYPSGSSMEENDVNSPSAESIIRQILYGTQYFRSEFGKTSAEFMLPDCFGFPASLPTILAHCGLKGFSTQKLPWGSFALVGGPNSPEKTPVGIPFNVGIWEGPDGRSVIAALNAGDYTGSITYDLSKTPPPPPPAKEGERRRAPGIDWPGRIQLNGQTSGLYTDYMYYGTGDTGGSPSEASIKLLEAIVTKAKIALPQADASRGQQGQQPTPPTSTSPPVQVGDGPLKVLSAASDQMFLDIKPEQMAKMLRYKGDLELTNHSAGSITSQAIMKRWNRMNEVLADGAERASVAAEWLGGRSYPLKRLDDAWALVMGGQFHDIIPGTSIPKAYEYSWNDEALAMNQFAGVLTGAAETVASALDTRGEGLSVVVFNPLNIAREDVVEASLKFPGGEPKAVRVYGPDGQEVPAQMSAGKVVFIAKVPSVGYAVYDVQAAHASMASTLRVTPSSLENGRYRLALDLNGDVASIFDKTLQRELLYTPARLEIKTDNPEQWPAWNMDWEDQSRRPRAYVMRPAKIRVVETGPARAAIEVVREAEGSTFVQTIRLAAGEAGQRVEFVNVIDWMTKEAHLKAVFPLTASNPVATYNWDIGTIQRSTNNPKRFEVPSHQWFDLTDESGAFGVTVLSDCKYASDKPDDNTLRLTLLRTPGVRGGYEDQGTQDWGHHDFVYGLAAHGGDFRSGQTDWQGFRLNQPLVAFHSPNHPGALGKTFSLMSLDNDRIRVLALKKAEQSDEIIVRFVEMDGKPARGVRMKFAAPVVAAREVTGTELPLGKAEIVDGALAADFTPFQVRSFALKLAAATEKVAPPRFQTVPLPYDLRVASRDKAKAAAGFDGAGRCLAAEMLQGEIPYGGIRFRLASADKPNAVVARGQSIALPVVKVRRESRGSIDRGGIAPAFYQPVELPTGEFNRVYILAAAADGDQKAVFRVGDNSVELTVQDWGGYIGQWDNRRWNIKQEPVPPRQPRPGEPTPAPPAKPRMRTVMEYLGLTPGFVKPAPVAWFASHRHTAAGENEAYAFSYLFAYAFDLPPNATALTLPNNDKIRILAVTVASEPGQVRPVQNLVDAPQK